MSASIASVRGLLFVVRRPKQVLALLGGSLLAFLYVWYAAVRAVPGVKRRKAVLRRERERAWHRALSVRRTGMRER
jgi:hypothetical protein